MNNFITLVVVTTGEDVEKQFNLNQPLQVVFNQAIQSIGNAPNRDQFTLEYQDQQLDLSRPIRDFVNEIGWVDGTVLELVPRPVVV